MKFSSRTHWDLEMTPWARLLHELREQERPGGRRVLDLTASNPTRCGFDYAANSLLAPLAAPSGLVYDPDPKGMLAARSGIADYYRDHGAQIPPDHLLLTSSSSEAYSFLFRLLADPGDEILIAQPSYPLLDFLAQVDDVVLKAYPLLYDHGWQIDRETLEACVGPRTRAIVLVHPNNPTGHFTSASDRAALEDLCKRKDLALIVDEVFLDYGLAATEKSFACGSRPALTFVISGISKIAGLPQMKISWIVSVGDHQQAAEARERLDVIADTFLPVSTPIACSLPAWLKGSSDIRRQILDRLHRNLDTLDRLLDGQSMVSRLEVQAGWYAVLRIPAIETGEEAALALLSQRSVAVHAGEFFGFPSSGWLVVSLLPPRDEFAAGTRALIDFFNR